MLSSETSRRAVAQLNVVFHVPAHALRLER